LDVDRAGILAWYRASLVQVAAESHFATLATSDQAGLLEALARGNNPPGFQDTQYIRMVRRQAAIFLDQYAVVDHHPNDWTGFSATLLRDRESGRHTLAIRSTEYRDWLKGGDSERDSLAGANRQIALRGFAVAQLAALEEYYRAPRADWIALPSTDDVATGLGRPVRRCVSRAPGRPTTLGLRWTDHAGTWASLFAPPVHDHQP